MQCFSPAAATQRSFMEGFTDKMIDVHSEKTEVEGFTGKETSVVTTLSTSTNALAKKIIELSGSL